MLTLLVLYVTDPDASLRFYTAVGLRFAAEQHGGGPLHYAAQLPAGWCWSSTRPGVGRRR